MTPIRVDELLTVIAEHVCAITIDVGGGGWQLVFHLIGGGTVRGDGGYVPMTSSDPDGGWAEKAEARLAEVMAQIAAVPSPLRSAP